MDFLTVEVVTLLGLVRYHVLLLLRLTFGVNVQECPACGGRMELRALVRDPESIERFLRHQGLWSAPPSLSPARAPPYDRRVAGLRASTQQELFPDS
jgi:hypothetical protein